MSARLAHAALGALALASCAAATPRLTKEKVAERLACAPAEVKLVETIDPRLVKAEGCGKLELYARIQDGGHDTWVALPDVTPLARKDLRCATGEIALEPAPPGRKVKAVGCLRTAVYLYARTEDGGYAWVRISE